MEELADTPSLEKTKQMSNLRDRQVAVVVPLYRLPLTEEEENSLASVRRYLGAYRLVFVSPAHLRLQRSFVRDEDRVISFRPSDFKDIRSYNRLLLSKRFYRAFEGYEYLLICQLDSLVLSDQLAHWIGREWDYIGAPWSEGYLTSNGAEFTGVGNGGFSLRRVAAALRVLDSPMPAHSDYVMGPPPGWWYWKRVRKAMLALNALRRHLPPITASKHLRRFYHGNEDVFWGRYAVQLDPSFRVAPVEEALRFAFEVDPRGCFARNGGHMPFGCHAWTRYDRSFWEAMTSDPAHSELSGNIGSSGVET